MKRKHHGRCLAVQISPGELRLAGVQPGRGGAPELLASAVAPLPEGAVLDGELLRPETVARTLRGLLDRPDFRRVRRAGFCLCSSQILSESVHVPAVKPRQLGQLLYSNLDLYFPVRPEDYALVWEPEPSEGPELRLRVWAAPRALLESYQRLATACGLRAVSLDYACNSLRRAARAEPIPPDDALLLYVGREALLFCFQQEGRVLLQRVLSRGDFDDGAPGDLGMMLDYCGALSPGAALHTLRYGADTEEGCAFAETLALRHGLRARPLGIGAGTAWCLCLGAARSELDFGGPLEGSRIGKALRRWLPPALGGAALLAAAALCLGAQQSFDASLEALRERTEAAEALLPELREVARAAQREEAADAASQEASIQYNADLEALSAALRFHSGALRRALEELTAALPEDCALCYLGAAEARLYIQLACPDKAGAAAVLSRLRALELSELLAVSDLSQGPQAGAPRFPGEDGSAWSAEFSEAQRRLTGDRRVFFTLLLELREEPGVGP